MPTTQFSFFRIIRIIAYVYLFRRFRHQLKMVPDLKKKKSLITFLALLLGAVVYKICSMFLDKICSSVLNMKRLNSTDKFFLQNGIRSGGTDSNVCIFMKIKRQPFEKIKAFARDHYCKFKKCRVMLAQAFGNFYWKQISDAEFEERFEKAIVKVEGVHTEDELDKFIGRQADYGKLDPFTELPFRWFVIEDFSETHSEVGLMFHHAWQDGISYVTKLFLLRKDKTPRKNKQVVPSLAQRMMISAMAPFHAMQIFKEMLMMRVQRNVSGGTTVKLQKPSTFCFNISAPRRVLEQRCKQIRTSPTLLAQSIYGQTMQEYSRLIDKKQLGDVQFSGIISDIQMPTTEEGLYLGNKIITPLLPLACDADPLKCTKMAKQNFMREMNPMRMAGYKFILDSFESLPFDLNIPPAYLASIKTAVIITSIPLNFEPDLEGDFCIERMHGYSCRVQATRSVMCLSPAGPNYCFCISSDLSRIKEPEAFKQIYIQKLNEFLTGKWINKDSPVAPKPKQQLKPSIEEPAMRSRL